MLRYLFANLIDEEIKRDELFRQQLIGHERKNIQRENAPSSIQIPTSNFGAWQGNNAAALSSGTTPRPSGHFYYPSVTPGLAIGLATPAMPPSSQGTQANGHLQTTMEEESSTAPPSSHQSQPRQSSERTADYFSIPPPLPGTTPGAPNGKVQTPNGSQEDAPPQSPAEQKDSNTKEGTAIFGKKFRMTFGMKKLSKTFSTETPKPATTDEKSEDSDSRSSKVEDRLVEDNFLGVIQRMRHSYEEQVQDGARIITCAVTPSLPNDTPVLKPPSNTTILIQEDRPDQGGVADLFEGTVGTVGQQADLIEKAAPMWLGDVLLRVRLRLSSEVSRC